MCDAKEDPGNSGPCHALVQRSLASLSSLQLAVSCLFSIECSWILVVLNWRNREEYVYSTFPEVNITIYIYFILLLIISISKPWGSTCLCSHSWCTIFLIIFKIFKWKSWGLKLGLLISEGLHLLLLGATRLTGDHFSSQGSSFQRILGLFPCGSSGVSLVPGLLLAFVPKDIRVICLLVLSFKLSLSSFFFVGEGLVHFEDYPYFLTSPEMLFKNNDRYGLSMD